MSRTKDPLYFWLETSVTDEHRHILGSKLPTVKQVLISCVSYNRKFLRDKTFPTDKTLHKAATFAIKEQVLPIYDKARIPTKVEKNMVLEVIKLYKHMNELRKIKPEKRADHAGVIAFKTNLESTMMFWPKDAEEIISSRRDASKHEDLLFFRDQMNERKFTIGGLDKNLAKTENNSFKRKEKEMKRKEKASIPNETTSSQLLDVDCDDDGDDPEVKIDKPKTHKRVKKTGGDLHMSHDILKKKKIVSTAIRNKISPTSMSAVLQSIVEECGGDPTKYNLHYTQSYR